MAGFDVAAFVANLEHLGVKLTAVPLADGKLRISRWRTVHAVEHADQIHDLWESQVGENQGRIDILAAFLNARAASQRWASEPSIASLRRAR
jgi:hypothetical protein